MKLQRSCVITVLAIDIHQKGLSNMGCKKGHLYLESRRWQKVLKP